MIICHTTNQVSRKTFVVAEARCSPHWTSYFIHQAGGSESLQAVTKALLLRTEQWVTAAVYTLFIAINLNPSPTWQISLSCLLCLIADNDGLPPWSFLPHLCVCVCVWRDNSRACACPLGSGLTRGRVCAPSLNSLGPHPPVVDTPMAGLLASPATGGNYLVKVVVRGATSSPTLEVRTFSQHTWSPLKTNPGEC